MRIEETAARFADVEKAIRQVIPPAELAAVVDNIGTYISSINTVYNNTGTIGESDGDIQISLKEGHAPTAGYVARLRDLLPRRFTGMSFSFLPADIVSQILNFGAPAPIDLQVRGNDLGADYAYANKLLAQIRQITGIADARIQQSARQPTIDVDLDRTRAQYTGVTAADVTNSLVVNLASSSQVAPTYWLNENNGVTYPIALQTPQYQLDTLPALENLPINATGAPTTVLGGIAAIRRTHSNAVVSQYDIAPMVEIYATTQGRDLGAVSADIQKIVAQNDKDKPKGSIVALVGQTATMNSAYSGLLFGLLGAIVLVYLRDRNQLPVLERPLHHHHRAACGARRHHLDAVCDAYHALGAGAHGRDHVHGRGDRKQRAGDQFRAREAHRVRRRDASCARGRIRALAPGADDGPRDGDRHVADGAGLG